MPSLEEAYWQRQPVLLEARELLQKGVADSFGEQSDCSCNFRIIELRDFLTSAKGVDGGLDDLLDSPELIVGTVTAPAVERLEEAKTVMEKLFTAHGKHESAAIYRIPPWAKPAAWTESLAMPTHLTIRYQLNPATTPEEETEPLSLFQPLTLALSGGGMRAAFYQLGILVFLAQLNRLKDIREIVSVSGGSILAAHFLKNWSKACGGVSGFRSVAAEFLTICRSDIRNRIFVPWLWSRLLPWCWFLQRKGRTGRLRAEYQRIYGATTLGDLDEGGPSIAFIATDGRHHQRVAFTASQILRWSFDEDHHPAPAPILAQGVELSLAVAASSCFPPVFPRLHLDHTDLGIMYGEFMEELHLNDGGVVTNLGIEVLIALRELDWTKGKLIVIADAERNLAVKPGNTPMADVDATLAALGKTAREAAKREFGASAIPIPFSDRVQNKEGLPFRVETLLFNYRTDLDCPTWQEMHGLMIHGAMVAKQATQRHFAPVSADVLKRTIATIIAEAEGPADPPIPSEDDFRRCGKRSYARIVSHAIAAVLLVLLLGGLAYGAARWIALAANAPGSSADDTDSTQREKVRRIAHSEIREAVENILHPFEVLYENAEFGPTKVPFQGPKQFYSSPDYMASSLKAPVFVKAWSQYKMQSFPTYPDVSLPWWKFFSENAKRNSALLDSIVQKYGTQLDADTLSAVHELQKDDFFRLKLLMLGELIDLNGNLPISNAFMSPTRTGDESEFSEYRMYEAFVDKIAVLSRRVSDGKTHWSEAN